jgi:hypothetical protein
MYLCMKYILYVFMKYVYVGMCVWYGVSDYYKYYLKVFELLEK